MMKPINIGMINMKTFYSCLFVVVFAMVSATVFADAENSGNAAKTADKGAPEITIPAAPMPSVAFPHKEHQDILKKCQLCHNMFPQKPGIISAMKAEKKLARKEVMNDKCLACHKERIKAGKPAGPVQCKGCHSVK